MENDAAECDLERRDGCKLKYLETKRLGHEFGVRLTCKSDERRCAADGDLITTVILSPQNSNLRSEVTVVTRVDSEAPVSCKNTVARMSSAGPGLRRLAHIERDAISADSPLEVQLRAIFCKTKSAATPQ